MDWEFKNFLSVWFLRKFGQGFALFLIFQSLLVKFENFENFCERKMLVFWNFAFLLVEIYNRAECELSEYWFFFKILLSLFFVLSLCWVLGNSWCCWFFWKFSKSFKSRKIWPGVCPILEILSFCLRLLKMSEIRKYSKCRFLGKIGQGSALHWCFGFLKFSKCGFLRKFDQGSAQFLKFWGFVGDFWKFLKFLKFLSVKF